MALPLQRQTTSTKTQALYCVTPITIFQKKMNTRLDYMLKALL